MNKIHLLPPDLVNKIAAGEVVERPASVVKELVENSIDAKATSITIEIQDAGKRLIRVTDNGTGMSDDEIQLALQRHSTSKINSLDDLFNIKSLGFRGEALPSIASVAKFEIVQNPSGAGLTITSKELFYNTPVRLKFLKSNYTELNHIQEIISRFILCWPEIAFKLIVDGREVLLSSGNGKLFDAIFAVYGLDIAKNMIEIGGNSPDAESVGSCFGKGTDSFTVGTNIRGYVSKPTVSRMDRGYEAIFVNKRNVQNFLLSRAVEEAYRNLIPNNRYPIAVLSINVNPQEVDVNVHPSKREVKFLKTKEIMDFVKNAVRGALEGLGLDAGLKMEIEKIESSEEKLPNFQFPTSDIQTRFQTQNQYPLHTFEITDIQPLIFFYQHLDTYLICTDGVDLVVIDQHAAHERVLFDKISNARSVTRDAQQSLLIPETLEFNHAEALIVEQNIEILKDLGFEIENFGRDSFIVRSVPSFLKEVSPKEILTELISELKTEDQKMQIDKRRDRINKFVACHAAVKAGDKLTTAEVQGLIRDLYKTENPMTCPHGRPTMFRITREELEKRFAR